MTVGKEIYGCVTISKDVRILPVRTQEVSLALGLGTRLAPGLADLITMLALASCLSAGQACHLAFRTWQQGRDGNTNWIS